MEQNKMINASAIEKKVLQKITPTNKDKKRIQKIIEELKKNVQKELTKKQLPAKIELVGSTAKDTYLRNNLDIDMFLLFPTSYQKKEIGRHAINIGRKILKKTEECYAEHPYIRGYYKNIKTEIVPSYQIEKPSQKLSAVDRTPLHTKYVIKNLKQTQKREVRLLKQFMRGIGCYGAEAEIEGFSGYLCEILIIRYGSFKELIKNAKNWETKHTITLTNQKHPDFDAPLIFIDPVDNNRNVASAVSKEKYELFIEACREYDKKPRITFFFPKKTKPWSLKKIKEEIKKQNHKYIGLKLDKPDIIPENLYPQIRKAIRSIKESCERNNFTIYKTSFCLENKKILIILETKKESLSPTMIHVGPPLELKQNAEDFIKKWVNNKRVVKKPYEKNGKLYVEIKREYTKLDEYLENQVKNLSLGKQLEKSKQKGYKIMGQEELLTEDLRVFWTEYLDGKKPWER
ncbi:MAG: CCA tRNA nucleotidyltransferase [Candidatus Thermoplasmatota archaeon]|jgi:tRNA nucleotidyltransferase (CCA-adding enzyme)|nr:CCA tRNA nucleotidyltransferase [Candidatus Thermoplasmatota archaeon]